MVSWLRRPVVGYLILALGVSLGFYFYQRTTDALERSLERIEHNARENAKARLVQCAQAADLKVDIRLQRRDIRRTVSLLRFYHGGLIFGIPRQLFIGALVEDRERLRQSYRTLENLSILDCKEE